MEITTVLVFTLSTAMIVAIPGPSILMIVAAGVAGGRRAALGALFAIITGDLILIALVAGGLGAMVELGGATMDWLTAVGGLVLVLLGLRMFREKRNGAPTQAGVHAYFFGSFFATIASPKSLLFFAAFLPQFIDPSRPVIPQYFILAVLFVIAGTPVGLAYALGSGWLTERSGPFRRIRDYGPRLAGLCLIALGAAGIGRILL